MYVDIGTKKDGLVHIKDVSRDYFIQDLKSRYAPGQDIDVWVKFVDGDKWKLGLQLFPLQPSISSSNGPDPSRERVYINSLVSKSLVDGTVARVSNFGVFIDIGAEVEAFLHRRKMKIVRKRRREQPWELYPLGSKVSVYIHSVDLAKRRISATTYAPDEWDTMLPNNNVRYDSDFTTDEDEDEELGGSTRAANLRALERTLALSLDGEFEDEFDESMENEDEDEEENDDYDEDDVDVIFESGSGSDRAQIVIDDFKDEDRSISSNNVKLNKNKIISKEEVEEDFSVDDLFIQLAKGKDFVNFNDLKRWGFLESLLESDELDENDLNLMFKEAGGSNRKLTESQFSEFIEILAQKIDDEEENIETSSPISDSNSNEILMSNKNSVNYLDSEQYLEAKRKAFEEYELDESEFDLNEEINQIDLDEVQNEDEDEDLIVEEVDEEVVKESFYELTENSKLLSLSKALSWEPIIELISNNIFDQNKFCDLFKEASNGSDELDFDGFVRLLDLLSPMIEDEESFEEEINEDLSVESDTGDNLYLGIRI
jgi:predicted RNA-binding protein with RPS1 domain